MAGKARAVDLSRLLSGAAEFLSRGRLCWLVTRSDAGTPRSRPMAKLPFDPAEGWIIRLVTDERTRKVDEIWRDQRVGVLCQDRGGAFVAATGRARLIFEREEVRELWRPAYDDFFPKEKRNHAAFLEVAIDQLDMWIQGVTPEPFGMQTTTLVRGAAGRWTAVATDA